jgi:peptidoglycan hydrolase-like protein with peptidoglycan-binding domain
MTFTGCLEDTRTIEEKQKDWHKDLATSISLNWIEKDFDEIPVFPVRDQDGSGSCVAQSLALILGIENFLEEKRFVEFSAKDIYTRRSNKDTMGMMGVEALEIARKYGCTLEALIPSQKQGESEINTIDRKTSDEEIAKIFRIKDYYQLPFSIEQIATIMESGRKNGVAKPLMVWFMFPRKEWDSKPGITNSNFDIVHHSVTAIDYGMMNGKKGIFIEDSWGLHNSTEGGLRFISEDYLKRMTFCAYVNDLPNDHQNEKPNIFTRVLRCGSRGDDVKELQKLLKINADGIFGRQTEKAVKSFQLENGLVADGIVGQKTIAKLLS